MTRREMVDFAEAWVAAWNRRDIESVLSHYTDNAEFISPKAAGTLGHPRVRGKPALAVYWRAALQKLQSLQFTLDRILWDAESRELLVLYQAELNGQQLRACEAMRFGPDGKIFQGEALYGASL